MARKYLKFGLRADKNLSDMTDKNSALNNILNDIASATSTEGTLLGFTKDDISALVGLSETGLGQDTVLDQSGLPIPLTRLAGTSVLTQNSVGDDIPVEPRVTIQDKINIHKNVMGDPPFANGGTGPDATFIPGDRLSLNANVIGQDITGNFAIVGNKYTWIGNTGTVNHDTLTADLNILTGESRAANAGAVAQVQDKPYIIHTVGTFDFTTRGAESNTVGLLYTASSGSNLNSDGKAIAGVLATTAVAGTKYTILAIGDTSVANWTELGCTEYPHVGTTFTAAVAGSDITGTTSYITEQWVVGNEISVTQTSPGSGVAASILYDNANRLNTNGTVQNERNNYPNNYIRLYISNTSAINNDFIDPSTVLSAGQTVTFSQQTDTSLGGYVDTVLFTTQTIHSVNQYFARIYWVDGSGNDVFITNTNADSARVNVTANITETNSFTSVSLIKLRNATMPSGDGQDNLPSSIAANKLYSTRVGGALTNIETTGDFWEDGTFEFPLGIHPNFTDTFGGVQWEGYQDGKFNNINFLTTGFFMLEEDVYDNDNWVIKKAITSETVYPIGKIKLASTANEFGTTVTQVEFSTRDDYVRVGELMSINLSGQGCQVQRLHRLYNSASGSYRYFADLDVDVSVTETTGTYVDPGDVTSYINFSWRLGVPIETGESIDYTIPATGKRRRVRYSVWWPTNNEVYGLSRLEELNQQSIPMSFNYFYKNSFSTDFTAAKNSFPFFIENKLGPRSQDSAFSTTVDDIISIEYAPSLLTTDKFFDFVENATDSHSITEELIEVAEEGTVSSTTSTTFFQNSKEGDWIVVRPATDPSGSNPRRMLAYQVIDSTGTGVASVTDTYRTEVGVALHEKHGAMLVSNTGLVGIYKHEATTGTGVRASSLSYADYKVLPEKLDAGLNGMDRDVSIISIGDIVHIADLDFTINSLTSKTHKYAFSVVHIETDNTIHLKGHPDNANLLTDASKGTIQPGIMAVYSSKGLVDQSVRAECIDVFGRAATVTREISPATNKIFLNSNGVTVGDFVQLSGSIPADTRVGSVVVTSDVTTSYILLADANGVDVNITSEITVGQTVVFITPSAANSQGYGGAEKEYCVVPLNTAPPWEGTSGGLSTTSTFSSLVVNELKFKNLALTTPAANIGPKGDGSSGTITSSSPTTYFSFYYDEPT